MGWSPWGCLPGQELSSLLALAGCPKGLSHSHITAIVLKPQVGGGLGLPGAGESRGVRSFLHAAEKDRLWKFQVYILLAELPQLKRHPVSMCPYLNPMKISRWPCLARCSSNGPVTLAKVRPRRNVCLGHMSVPGDGGNGQGTITHSPFRSPEMIQGWCPQKDAKQRHS